MPPSRRDRRRQRSSPAGHGRRVVRPWRLILILLGTLVAAGIVGGFVLYTQAMAGLPNVRDIPPLAGNTEVFDRYGHLMTVLHNGMDSQPVPLREIPLDLQHAVVATEDTSFYSNAGFDLRGLVRAAVVDLRGGGLQGGSTITEELGKMLYLQDNGSIAYKVKEILLGIRLAQVYSKAQIMDMYLNRLYLGDGTVGVQAAAEAYFGKPVSQLNLAQCALLAGLPQAPSYYDPLVNPKAALARRNEVLGRMAAVGYITAAEAKATEAQPLGLAPGAGVSNAYPDPWFVDAVIATLQADGFSGNQIFSGNLRVYTTFDPGVQAAADQAVTRVMSGFPISSTAPQAAVVVMQPTTGDVLALVGGRSHPPGYQTVLNLATQGHFQTGSAIKPLAEYPTALEHGDTEMTVVDDVPWLKVHGQWWPKNDTDTYLGRLPLKFALAVSDNNVAVRLEMSRQAGIDRSWDTAVHTFGLPLLPQDRNPSLGIGGLTLGVSPLNMATAFATLATGGDRPTPRIVTRVVAGATGRVLFRQPVAIRSVLSPQIAYLLTNMLEAVFTYPGATAYGNGIGRPVAGKTGTSSGGEDGWFVGYTPQLVTAVWEGHTTPVPQPGVFGATYALPIWRQTMEGALSGTPVENFSRPPGLVEESVDVKSGLLPSALTPPADIATGLFVAGTQPTRVSDVWQLTKVDSQDPHRLWEPGCPAPPETRVLLKRPQGLVPGAPLPLEASEWVPTLVCRGPGGQSGPPGGTGPTTPLSQSASITIYGGAPSPQSVTLEQGATVTLTIVNRDPATYVFEDTALGLAQAIPADGTIQFTFTPQTAGTTRFVLVGSAGPSGTLVVEAPAAFAAIGAPSQGGGPQGAPGHGAPGPGAGPPRHGHGPPGGPPGLNR
jgi:penicillin-binding protein 1A